MAGFAEALLLELFLKSVQKSATGKKLFYYQKHAYANISIQVAVALENLSQ